MSVDSIERTKVRQLSFGEKWIGNQYRVSERVRKSSATDSRSSDRVCIIGTRKRRHRVYTDMRMLFSQRRERISKSSAFESNWEMTTHHIYDSRSNPSALGINHFNLFRTNLNILSNSCDQSLVEEDVMIVKDFFSFFLSSPYSSVTNQDRYSTLQIGWRRDLASAGRTWRVVETYRNETIRSSALIEVIRYTG